MTPGGENRIVPEEASAEVAARLDFLACEMGWEYFRAEMLYFDDAKKERASLENAGKLKNYLAENGHGIAFLKRCRKLEAENAGLRKALGEIADADPHAPGITEHARAALRAEAEP